MVDFLKERVQSGKLEILKVEAASNASEQQVEVSAEVVEEIKSDD